MPGTFPASLAWTGDTLEPAYNRSGELTKPGGQAAIPVSAIAAFGGDDARWNPEDLLAGALSTCHMLYFLALAAKARVQVTGYQDHAEAELETVEKISRVGRIALRPVITVAAGSDHAKVRELFEKAHKYCVIANTIQSEVILEPSVVEA
jgi:organic hydroperoxide reductase OsmC/OhrA